MAGSTDISHKVLYAVSDELLAEYGLQPLGATAPSYRCDYPEAVLFPVGKLKPPVLAPDRRSLAPERLRHVLEAISTGNPLPAIPVFREEGAQIATILDGAHRYFASVACGFALIPSTVVWGFMHYPVKTWWECLRTTGFGMLVGLTVLPHGILVNALGHELHDYLVLIAHRFGERMRSKLEIG